MKYKNIIFLFAVFLPVSIVLRLMQLSFTVDYSTGFFIKEFETNGNAMLWVVLALCLAPAVFALFSHRNPEKPPKKNIAVSVASIMAAFSVVYELFFEEFSMAVLNWQITPVKVAGIVTTAFFICFALQGFIKFKIPDICTAIPVIYYILRMICDFTTISSLALISENLIVMLTYSMILLFMLQFAKLYNGIDAEYNFRKLLATGLSAVIMCFTQTVPHIILKLSTGYSFMHTSLATNVNIFFMGIFIAVFVFSHFSYGNSCLTEEEREEKQLSFKAKFEKLYKKF